MKVRPWGVTVLAVLGFVNVAAYVALLALSIGSMPTLRTLLEAISPGGAGPAKMHLGMGKLLPVYYAAMAGVTTAFAWGFWRLWNWVRIVALLMIVISLIATVPAAVSVIRSGEAGAIAALVARVGLSFLIGWYLVTAKVRDAFRKRALDAGSQTGLEDSTVQDAS